MVWGGPFCWDQCLYKKRHQRARSLARSFSLSATQGHSQEAAIYNLEEGSHQQPSQPAP